MFIKGKLKISRCFFLIEDAFRAPHLNPRMLVRIKTYFLMNEFYCGRCKINIFHLLLCVLQNVGVNVDVGLEKQVVEGIDLLQQM